MSFFLILEKSNLLLFRMETMIVEKCERNGYLVTQGLLENKHGTTNPSAKLDQFIRFMQNRRKRKNKFKVELSFDVSLGCTRLNL